MPIDFALAERLFASIRAATRDGPGVTRAAYGAGEATAHALVRAEGERLGLEIAVDFAGNLLMTLPGRDRTQPVVVVGSHLDSVRQGGDYDGTVGVVAALSAVEAMVVGSNVPRCDIVVSVVRAEESGSWFPTSFPGSRALLGRLSPEALQTRRLDTGRTLSEHMDEAGFDSGAVAAGRCLLPPSRVAAYVELHIEQGPVLDHAGVAVGVVTAVPGSRRLRAGRVFGETNHSGATPRAFRRDAAIALAEFAVALDDLWAELEADGHRLVLTFCVLATSPDAGFTKIAGEARFELDVRSVDPASVDAVFDAIVRLVPAIEARRGVRFDLGPETGSVATPMDARLRAELLAAADRLGITTMELSSGGGHDPVSFAQAGVPAALLFVANQHGSHTPAEAMRIADFGQAVRVLSAWLETAAE